MKAEAAREQSIAVGVVDHHPGPNAGHRHAARHQLGPLLKVGARVADDGRLAVRAAGGVDSDEPLASDREQAERIVVAQLRLGHERNPREVVERAEILGSLDARGRQQLGPARLGAQHARDRRA